MREHARRAGDRAREIESLAWLAATLFYGPTHAAEADVLQRGLIDEIGEHPWSAFALLGHGALLAMSGHSAEARVRRLDARAIDTTFGLVHGHSHFQIGGQIELYCDDLEAAEALLRAGCDHSMRHGETGYLSTTAALLGEALHRLGRDDEALEAADLGRRHAADDDIESQSRWRSVAAKVQARRGELGPAERLAREAVVLMEPTDMLDSRGETRLALAVVLQAAGRADEAAAEAEAALELFGRKGNVVTAEHARRLLATLGA
jgi:tetratricopeptide (TPR) repeat protein